MAPYQYSSLKESLNEIRVLTLHPGDFSADLHVSIHKVTLRLDSPPIYEALSYVWGTTENPVELKVDPSGNETLAITQNLAIALPYLRFENKTRTLWIDAICINQQDLRERSSQVKIMGDIYRLAERVVVWLGTEKDDSANVLEILSKLSSEIKVDYAQYTMSPASSESTQHWSDTKISLPYSRNELSNINALLHRSWFSRLWVWQEIRLARRNSILICGLNTILWQSLCQALFCLGYKQWADNNPSLGSRIHAIINISNSVSYGTFGDIIRRTASCKCSDPRDRIYAILSLLDKSDKRINIEPDYSKTTVQVYQELTLQHINHHKSLNMLAFCELQNDMTAEMPTWVPNWAVTETATPVRGFGEACGYSYAEAEYESGGVLSATGVISATILSAEEMGFRDAHDTNDEIVDEIRSFAPRNSEHSPYIAGGSLIDAFCSTICANVFTNMTWPPHPVYPQFEKSRDFLLAILEDSSRTFTYTPGSDVSLYLGLVLELCHKRSFITTEEGYIGLAPEASKPGDQICVLLGCKKPLVLRPTPDLQYQVVGECYVHGLGDAEALLGPLPENYQSVHIYDEELKLYFWAFMDKETGNTQYQDPRMEKGGQMVKAPRHHLDGSEVLEVNSEMLWRRGVQVQKFDLI